MVTLHQVCSSINVLEMQDGDIAIIDNWPIAKHYKGRIVQRYRNGLITLGASSGHSLPDVFAIPDRTQLVNHTVQILPKGTTLVI